MRPQSKALYVLVLQNASKWNPQPHCQQCHLAKSSNYLITMKRPKKKTINFDADYLHPMLQLIIIIIIICFTSFLMACFLIWWDSLVAQKPFGYFPFSFGRSEITNQNPKSNAANSIHLPFSKASHLSVSSSEINFCYLCTLLALQSIHGSKFCCHHLLTMVSCD